MVIETIGRDYRITGRPDGDGAFLCESTADGKRYLAVPVDDSELDAAAIDFLYRQTSNPVFSDLADCFVDRKTFFVTFKMHEGAALGELLSGEDMSLEERLYLLRKILECAILQKTPHYFLARCLSAENIFSTHDFSVSFRYDLRNLKKHADGTMRQVQLALRTTVALVFSEELKKEVIPPVKSFIASLETEEYADCMEIYKQLSLTALAVMRIERAELQKPKTLPFRIWERLQKGFKPLKRILAAAILVAVLGYMIMTFQAAGKDSGPAKTITKIGTMEILDLAPETAGEAP